MRINPGEVKDRLSQAPCTFRRELTGVGTSLDKCCNFFDFQGIKSTYTVLVNLMRHGREDRLMRQHRHMEGNVEMWRKPRVNGDAGLHLPRQKQKLFTAGPFSGRSVLCRWQKNKM